MRVASCRAYHYYYCAERLLPSSSPRYTLSTPSGNSKNKAGESLAVRIKARFLSIKVLPSEQYKDFAEHVSHHYLDICKTLGNVLPVAKKDEIAKILVNVMYATGSYKVRLQSVCLPQL